MLKQILTDIVSPDYSPMERVVALFLVVTMVGALGFAGFLAFKAIDTVGVSATRIAVTTIERKEFIPAYTTHGFMLVGKVLIPTTQYHPDSYGVHFRIGDERLRFEAVPALYNRLRVGDRIEVDYRHGRLTGGCEPTNIRTVNETTTASPALR